MKSKTNYIVKIGFIVITALMLLSIHTVAANEDTATISTELIKSDAEDNILEVMLNIKMDNMPEGINAYTGKIEYSVEQLKLMV